MTDLTPIFPRQIAPSLAVPLIGGGTFDLDREMPANFTMVVFYRGYHCPLCKVQLADLHGKLEGFADRGVGVVAISSDTPERAQKAAEDWKLPDLRIGHSLSLAEARRWGLYVSRGRGLTSTGVEEPSLFSEPGLFLVRPKRELYFANVQTMPFARPHFQDLLGALDFVIAKAYPGRGEVVDLSAAG